MPTKEATVSGTAQDASRATLDEATMAELYRLHGAYLLRALMRITNGDRGKAEDIVQETLLRAWRNPGSLTRGAEGARPWLFCVARRIAIDHFRMASARLQEICDEAPKDVVPTCDPYDEVLGTCDVQALLAALPAHQRDVLVELYLNGRSVADTARVLGVPAGTVKSRNYYAVRALRPMLEAAGVHAA